MITLMDVRLIHVKQNMEMFMCVMIFFLQLRQIISDNFNPFLFH